MKSLHSLLPNWLLIGITICVAAFFLAGLAGIGLALAYQGRVLPNVSVGGAYVGGLDEDAAREAISRKVASLGAGIPVRYGRDEIVLGSDIASLDPDFVPPVVFDEAASLAQAMAFGHSTHYLSNAWAVLRAMFGGNQLPLSVTVDQARLASDLRQAFAKYEKTAADARVRVTKQGKAEIIPENDGQAFDYQQTATEAAGRFAAGSRQPIEMALTDVYPTIRQSAIGDIQPDIDRLLETPAAHLTYEKLAWNLDQSAWRSFIGLALQSGQVRAVFDPAAIKAFLEKEVVPKVNRQPEPPRLAIENGRVSVWQEGSDGITVDLDSTAAAVAAWPQEGSGDIPVSVHRVPVQAADASAQDLGIKEIIGTGTSRFSGSPANRRHNIRIGAMSLHGLLIKPGEEFSLLKALGAIDASNGYKTELVIKGNKTQPEFGGGLCQVGTTIFRATFNSGLPVTQRHNHSYRVSYYEPAGTDATIYDPAPDYRFINDTGHYILIQARIGDNELSFDLWGTKDGRQVEVTKPTIYNIVPPKPTKIVETTELPEGKKKCTESAHAGADAFFDTKVTYPDGTVKSKRFSSHYVPWQAVCLVGVKALSPAPVQDGGGSPTATVTPTVIPAP